MPRYTKETLQKAVSESTSYGEVLSSFSLREAGGNYKLLKDYISIWNIDTSHFPSASERAKKIIAPKAIDLSLVMTENSSYHRSHLKERLYKENIKQRTCEMCDQGEIWNGKKMSLILDHINGIFNDNRLENLRIVCPNCNATLDTHCGKNTKKKPQLKTEYIKKNRSFPKPEQRKVERPSYEVLLEEIKSNSFLAMGRKYGVSDNAIRKWIKSYEKNIQNEINNNTSVG
jgi:hypothetical protein